MINVNSATPVGFLLLMLQNRARDTREQERGASAVEWVVISAIVVALVIAVGFTLRAALTGKADDISNQIKGS